MDKMCPFRFILRPAFEPQECIGKTCAMWDENREKCALVFANELASKREQAKAKDKKCEK